MIHGGLSFKIDYGCFLGLGLGLKIAYRVSPWKFGTSFFFSEFGIETQRISFLA